MNKFGARRQTAPITTHGVSMSNASTATLARVDSEQGAWRDGRALTVTSVLL
eukprot:SAG31_NODE_5815_length_2312_cov_1.915047_2_plen_52_part_00